MDDREKYAYKDANGYWQDKEKTEKRLDAINDDNDEFRKEHGLPKIKGKDKP